MANTENFGITSDSQDTSLAAIIKQIVYLKADAMLVFKDAIEMQGLPNLDYNVVLPESWYLQADEASEGARVDIKNLRFSEVKGSMRKYQVPIFLTDEITVRQIENSQMQLSLDGAAQGLALKKDQEIRDALYAGANQTQAAVDTWGANGADPATDIANAIGKILSNTTLSDNEINQINFFYPAKLFGHTAKPLQIGDVQESLRSWVKREYSIGLYPTRQLDALNTGIATVKTPRMGIHFTHDGSKIPGAEQFRETGVGNGWLVSQYFKTVVFPFASGETKSNYICKVTGISS